MYEISSVHMHQQVFGCLWQPPSMYIITVDQFSTRYLNLKVAYILHRGAWSTVSVSVAILNKITTDMTPPLPHELTWREGSIFLLLFSGILNFFWCCLCTHPADLVKSPFPFVLNFANRSQYKSIKVYRVSSVLIDCQDKSKWISSFPILRSPLHPLAMSHMIHDIRAIRKSRWHLLRAHWYAS